VEFDLVAFGRRGTATAEDDRAPDAMLGDSGSDAESQTSSSPQSPLEYEE